jgi:protein-disulfide isomerase
VHPDLVEILRTDKKVRVVFKEFPILGPESLLASKAALAAWLTDKGKYQAFHDATMKASGALPDSRLMKIAADVGLDVKALKKTMSDPRIERFIDKNYALAEALDIKGTPAFVIGDQIVRGAIDVESMRLLIAKARVGK